MRSDIENIWAKSPKVPGERGESLERHTLATIAVLRFLRLRHPGLADVVDEPRLWEWAQLALYLHDLGKAAEPFQMSLRGKAGPWGHRHEVASLAFLPYACGDSSARPWVAAAVASHHRDAQEILDRYDPRAPVEDTGLAEMVASLPEERAESLVQWLTEVVGVPMAAKPDSGSERRQSVLTVKSVLEALRDYRSLLRRGPGIWFTAVALRGLVIRSDHAASGGITELATVSVPTASELAERLLRVAGAGKDGANWSWYKHQEQLAALEGHALLTAPTGTGKTEAAVLWASRQQRAQPGGVLVYLLPYQASITAMHARLRRLLRCEVALLHGRALQALYAESARASDNPSKAEYWARRAREAARLQRPAVWVATPYQLLRAAYRLPGYETLWVALSHSCIIMDEVHAYEPRRLGLLAGFLKEAQQTWCARLCTMTATMPTWLRRYLGAELQLREVWADPGLYRRLVRHRISVVQGTIEDGEVINAILREREAGRSVLVSVNTVSAAQRIWRRLSEEYRMGSNLLLLHSRFSGIDRQRKETRVLARAGLGRAKSVGQGLIVVSTQVVEVSLNLDFDTIFTEPAPLEAILQRFGRVNRRGTHGVVPVHVLQGPLDGQHVYDPVLVERSFRVLADADGKELNEREVNGWLDLAYRQDLAEKYLGQVVGSATEFRGGCLANRVPFQSDTELEQRFDELFDGTEVLPEALVADYRRARERSLLEASGYFVPVRTTLVTQLVRQGKAVYDRDLRAIVVAVPYCEDGGLTLPGEGQASYG